jgi:hypothetical protein
MEEEQGAVEESAPCGDCGTARSARHSTGGTMSILTNDLAWVSIAARRPKDRELVYARAKSGLPKKVTFYARPSPRWEGSSIVYDFLYFAEWAVATDARKTPGH